MKYEQTALEYSGITMDLLRSQGADIRKIAEEVIAFAARNTLCGGKQCRPVLIGQNIAFDVGFLQQMMNYAGLMAEFEKTFAGTKDYYGNFQPHYIDTLHIGRLAFAADAEVSSYKLELIAARLGWNWTMLTTRRPTSPRRSTYWASIPHACETRRGLPEI